MPLTPGTKLGPYQIESLLGAGGTGEVYRARDTRLDRTVAIKILTQGVADTPKIRQRVERHEWVAYALNKSGDWKIYVTTFPTAAGKWQASQSGGSERRWRGDSKEIFYIGAGGTLTAVPVSTTGTFASSNPTPLLHT
jgi:serine/threonine protein kinase